MIQLAKFNFETNFKMQEFAETSSSSSKGMQIPNQSLGLISNLRIPRSKDRDLERTESGAMIMNSRNLKIICENQGLYEDPSMNNKIYLHFKVIEKISGLHQFVNLKTLYLENNVIRKIQNLESLKNLQNLFLQNNMIKKIQNLEKLKQLKIFNISNNQIFVVEGLSELSSLQNLCLNKNFLSDFESLEQLGHCSQTLTAIDLSDNKIVADEKLFGLIQQVKCLYLSGNPLVREVLHYRRTLIGKLKNLMYLDQRTVDRQEKILADAWIEGGEQALKKAKQEILQFRKQKKLQERQQIMKGIDIHRKKKINVFEGNIRDFEQQIHKLRGYIHQRGNENMIPFYQSRIAELMQKIRQNQVFIDSIYKRMGIEPLPPIYTIQIDEQVPEAEQGNQTNQHGQQNISRNLETVNQVSEDISQPSQEHSQIESQESQPLSNQSSSHQSSLKTYNSYDELD